MPPVPTDLVPHDYQAMLELLYERINYEKASHSIPYTAQHYRLDRMRELLGQLGNPQLKYPILHIAGTKGKGTTATLLYDALRANGLRTALYTSPHLLRLEERFQFDGKQCSPSELVELSRSALDAAQTIEDRGFGRATFFEVTTAMGLLYFAQQKADCVVLEVGLGGRLDSTNVCTPILSIITSISLDHQSQLGHTIEAIANEKAGIIKPGVPIISTVREPEARKVIRKVAEEQTSLLMLMDRDFSVRWKPIGSAEENLKGIELNAVGQIAYHSQPADTSDPFAHSTWQTCMMGRHQADNLAGAIAALQWLNLKVGWKINIENTRFALAKSHAEARLQIVGRNPIRMIDTAHNPVSIAAGLQALSDHFGDIPRVIVFACSRDKEYRTMLEQILPNCDRLICTNFRTNPRAVNCSTLGAVARELSMADERDRLRIIDVVDEPHEAWQLAKQVCPPHGIVVAMGSFFLAAELLATDN